MAGAQRSGKAKAGELLLLVGGILQLVLAGLMVFFGALAILVTWNGVRFVLLGLVVGAGGILGLAGYDRARAGNHHGAFSMGLAGTFLPPMNVVLLLGAILCKVSPEAQSPPPIPPAPGPVPQPQTR